MNPDLVTTKNTEPYLTEEQASELVGISASCLKQVRLYSHRRKNLPTPPHYRIGRTIRYRASELVKWMNNFQIGEK